MRTRSLFPLLLAIALPLGCASPERLGQRIDLLGDPAPPAAATRTIVITPETKWVNVTGGEIVKFVAGDKIFAWNFDGGRQISNFELNRVAPPGTLNHRVVAYVAPDPRYIGGNGRHGGMR
jgi:hypothetical protein